MHSGLLLLFIFSSSNVTVGQALDYAFAVGSHYPFDNYTFLHGLAVDQDGNTFITGTLEHINLPSKYDFDPGPGEYYLENMPSTGCIEDIYLAKYDVHGALLWGFVLGSSSCDDSYEVATDKEGNAYIFGTYSGTVDFDPGPGEFLMTGENFDGAFLAKYTADGDFVWAMNNEELDGDYVKEIEVDDDGNIYLFGEYFADTVDLDFGEGEYIITNNGNRDVFVAKYDENARIIWGASFGDTEWDRAGGIEVDANGDVIITGSFEGTIDIDRSTAVYELNAGAGQNMFLVKYNRNGRLHWGFNVGEDDDLFAFDVAVDAYKRITVTGTFDSVNGVDFDASGDTYVLEAEDDGDAYVVRYLSDGSLDMATRFGGERKPFAREVELNPDGTMYVAGEMFGLTDFDPGPAKKELDFGNDAFIAKYTEEGHLIWVAGIGEAFYGINVEGLVVDPFGNIHIAGYFGEAFNNTLDFDPTESSYIVDYIGANYDLYVAQYRDPQPQYRVNSGGPVVADPILAWSRDTRTEPSPYFNTVSGNHTRRTPLAFANPTSAPSSVFNHYRTDERVRNETIPMEYTFPVENGDFNVCLLFVEPDEAVTESGLRDFFILVEEELRYVAFDIVENTGVATAMRKCFYDQVTDGTLNIELLGSVIRQYRPVLHGVEITPVTASVSRDEQSIAAAAPATLETKLSVSNAELPEQNTLKGNYPNPFNPTTTIHFELKEAAPVTLTVYDVLGRVVQQVVNGTLEAGSHELMFDAQGLPGGTYLYKLDTPHGSYTKKMLLLK